MTIEEAKKKLAQYHQEHILNYINELTESQIQELLTQISSTDFSVLTQITDSKQEESKRRITPIKALTLSEIQNQFDTYQKTGIQAIQQGKVAAVLLAGGMGTRLGSDHPKGMYDIGITKPIYIFQRLIENLLDVVSLTGTDIPLFIMTSDKNHTDTTTFFAEHDYFGYKKENIYFFQQDMAPASTYEGKVYMEAKNKIATSPNGNGGWFTSLINAGYLDVMNKLGVEWLNVFAVDNVLQKIADPVFIGATLANQKICGAKVVRKNHPDEKVGVMCQKDGHPSIIEYYELTDQLRNTKDESGEPAYNFGVILNYLFNISALESICKQKMPLHIVEKKIPYIDESGLLIKPEEPNGYKFETLILDMIELMDNCLPFEVVREKEFAPIKNKTGVDSVESARTLLQQNGYQL